MDRPARYDRRMLTLPSTEDPHGLCLHIPPVYHASPLVWATSGCERAQAVVCSFKSSTRPQYYSMVARMPFSAALRAMDKTRRATAYCSLYTAHLCHPSASVAKSGSVLLRRPAITSGTGCERATVVNPVALALPYFCWRLVTSCPVASMIDDPGSLPALVCRCESAT